MRVTVLLGHTNPNSLCAGIAAAYMRGLEAGGHEARLLDLGSMDFDPILANGYRERMDLEPALESARADIEWCEHFVLVYPIWWGQMPAKLKGFFDRTFLPGWAFKYHEDDPLWDRLLAGRSARLIVTTDAPAFYNWLVYYGAPIHVTRKMVLRFSGFKPVRVSQVDSVKSLEQARATKLFARFSSLGRRAG